MKKCLAMIMAMVLMLSMSTVAFAERGTGTGDEEQPVTLNVTKAGTVYKIDLEWGSTDFVYNLHAGTWQADTHTYSGGAAGWAVDTANGQEAVMQDEAVIGVASTITATNHSNAVVYVQAAYVADGGFSNGTVASELVGATDGKVKENLDDASKYIAAWTSGTPADCTCDFTFQVTGTPTVAAADVTVGTITVTISETPIA